MTPMFFEQLLTLSSRPLKDGRLGGRWFESTAAYHLASNPPPPQLAAFSLAAFALCPLPNLLCQLPPLFVAEDEAHGDKLT